MTYSSIHNVDTSLKYVVRLDGEVIRRDVQPHHVDSIVYSLESEGINISDEIWNDDEMAVDLLTTTIFDDFETDDDYID